MLPWVGEEERMNNNNNFTSFAVIAIMAALALFGVVAITLVTIPLQQQAEARPFTPVRGCDAGGVAFNASLGRCFNP
jgi:hypothetical protein